MKYPEYGIWCKKTIIETIRKQKIHAAKTYLNNLVFNPYGDLYSSGLYDYEISDILRIINGDIDPSRSLFSTVQHVFAEKYFQMAQEINPQTDMKVIRRNGGGYTRLLYRALENIPIDEIKNAVIYAFEYGTEETKEAGIPYIKTNAENIGKVISGNLAEIESAHINYVDPRIEQKKIPVDEFIGHLMHLSQSGIFSDMVNWRYADLFDSGKCLIEGDISHNNGYELGVVVATKNVEDKDKVVEILKGSKE